MKKFFKIFSFILLLQIMACKPTALITSSDTTIKVKDSITEKEWVVRIDTFFQQVSDSAKTIIYIDCDSLNNPNINSFNTTQGDKLKIDFKFGDSGLTTKEKNRLTPLYVNCKIDSNKVAFSYFNTHKEKFNLKSTDTSQKIIIKVPVEKNLTKKQVFLMQLGKYTLWFFIIIIALLVGFGFAKLIKYMKWL